jgi:hypothetical protein
MNETLVLGSLSRQLSINDVNILYLFVESYPVLP